MKRYIRRLAITGFILLNVAGARDGRCQLTENDRKPVVGDAPADPGPLATDLSGELHPRQ
jgi:unsaturated rhamnogalacturonyl hydrolase